ncbi:hypothetical protein Tsubulata_029159 [Turnera subulata]|uniref:Uncharacterized protein n=1 Tax=Turnera subulata TaxID=218843 RepID=A0A9Q0FXX3_9ROSI|nr:hypothetical protein Tsubulata_029159 [Turnera subulata]
MCQCEEGSSELWDTLWWLQQEMQAWGVLCLWDVWLCMSYSKTTSSFILFLRV